MENNAYINNEGQEWITTSDVRQYLIENNMWGRFNYEENMDGSTTILSAIDDSSTDDDDQYGCVHLNFANADDVGDYGIFEVTYQMAFKNNYEEYVQPIQSIAMPKAFKYKLNRQCAHLLVFVEAVLLPQLTYHFNMRNYEDEVGTTNFKPNYNFLSIEYDGEKGIIELDELQDREVHGYGYGEATAKYSNDIRFPNHNFYVKVQVLRDGDDWVIDRPLMDKLDVEVV